MALEITTAAHEPWVQLTRRVSAQSGDVVPALRHTWTIRGHFGYLPLQPEGAPDVRAVRHQASLHLRSLEDAGVDGFDELFEEEPTTDLAASVCSLRQLGITAAHCHPNESPPAKLILRGLSGYSGAVSPDAINHVVEVEVARNCAKLQRAMADEHHLFIWVDPSIGAAGISIADDRLPDTGPTLPETVTTVWLGFAHNMADQLDLAVLWRCDNGGCWARTDHRTSEPGQPQGRRPRRSAVATGCPGPTLMR